MSRRALTVLAAAALAGAACTSSNAPAVTIGLIQPSAVAVFRGFVADATPADAATKLRPYLAIANAARNDLTIVDATDDTAVQSPIQLKALLLPFADRPALLAAASLGDDKADLLVAVSGGDSVLQVVETWTPANGVHSNPGEAPARAVDLGADVLAVVALPSPQGTARVAAALAGRLIAVVEWARRADDSIALAGPPVITPLLPFQPLDLAVLPDDPAVAGVQTEIYAATVDELAPGVFGVAAIPADLATAPRALDARGPTRLVGAARLRERLDPTCPPIPPGDPSCVDPSTAPDASAFKAAPVPRVYAVLDESGCGRERQIDCGVVTLDPTPGVEAIPADWAGRMPYRSPMRVPGRISAFAVSQPPAFAPAEPPDPAAVYAGAFMRLFDGAIERATTAVAAAASDDGSGTIYFLDLGRFELAVQSSPVATKNAGTPVSVKVAASTTATPAQLWPVLDASGTRSFPANAVDAAKTLTITPGNTNNEGFTVSYQGFLPTLTNRGGEAGLTGAPGSDVWIALQRGEGAPAPGRSVSNVVRVFHPALGVHPGDLVVVNAAGVPGCTGTAPEESTTDPQTVAANGAAREFEVVVAELLEPTDRYPGGALRVTAPAPPATGETASAERVCYEALTAQIGTTAGATRLDVSIRASGLVLVGTSTGYAGRPELGVRYALEYPAGTDEDALAALCPIAGWDGSFPVSVPTTCGTSACDRGPGGDCEKAALARKTRRLQYLSFPCDATCQAQYPGVVFPQGNGPVVALEVDVQSCPRGTSTCSPLVPATPEARTPLLVRGLSLTVAPSGGVNPVLLRPTTGMTRASSAIAFDRSPVSAASGYRFIVSYPANFVLDTSPSVNPVDAFIVR